MEKCRITEPPLATERKGLSDGCLPGCYDLVLTAPGRVRNLLPKNNWDGGSPLV